MFYYIYALVKLLWAIDKTYYACKRVGTVYMLLNGHGHKYICWRKVLDPIVVWQRNVSNMRLRELIGDDYFKRDKFRNNFLDS